MQNTSNINPINIGIVKVLFYYSYSTVLCVNDVPMLLVKSHEPCLILYQQPLDEV